MKNIYFLRNDLVFHHQVYPHASIAYELIQSFFDKTLFFKWPEDSEWGTFFKDSYTANESVIEEFIEYWKEGQVIQDSFRQMTLDPKKILSPTTQKILEILTTNQSDDIFWRRGNSYVSLNIIIVEFQNAVSALFSSILLKNNTPADNIVLLRKLISQSYEELVSLRRFNDLEFLEIENLSYFGKALKFKYKDSIYRLSLTELFY